MGKQLNFSMNKLIRKARKRVGLYKFEKECKCGIMLGRRIKRYRIPGSIENGKYNMLMRMMNDIYVELEKEEINNNVEIL